MVCGRRPVDCVMNPEFEHYLHMIEDLRGQVRDLIAGLPAEALNWRPLPGAEDHAMNSLAVLAAHVAGAEHFWIAEVVGGQAATRDRPAEFTSQVDGPDSLLRRLDEVGVETREVFAGLTEADLDQMRKSRGKPVTVRWGILHVIDHTALHLGHMQITYQLWIGGASKPSPRWYERVP
ncbi:MAG: DinB family protein [Chloroflexota bacterium]|nr:DinB family protein [Chloroflexota bacterium]